VQTMDKGMEEKKRLQDPLAPLLSPASVAVIGASDRTGSVGAALFSNLLAQPFGGELYAVNPARKQVMGVPSFESIGQVPGPVDLAVVVIPAPAVPDAVRQCAQAGVKVALIISAGFSESGAAGAALERASLEAARGSGLRLVGPNCLGAMAPHRGLNASFARGMAPAGNVAFASQSGALLAGILDQSPARGIGFSAVLSLGSMLDIGWAEAIEHFGADEATRCILLYMESLREPGAFLKACARVAPRKPIVLLKAGRSQGGGRAAASHTGAMMQSDAVLSAAFRRCGILRVDSVAELFSAGEALSLQPLPRGGRLAIVTNAGGPGVLAADALERGGGVLAEISKESLETLNQALPEFWSHGNPVDILGDATPARYAEALRIAGGDPGNDGLLVVLTPQFMTNPDAVAHDLCGSPQSEKPVYTSFMGGAAVAAGVERLRKNGLPCFAYPDAAAALFCRLAAYGRELEHLGADGLQAPPLARHAGVDAAHGRGEPILSEGEAKELVAAYGLPVVEGAVAHSLKEAQAAAARLGYPVVLKAHSHKVTHKSSIGGVRLDLRDKDDLAKAYAEIQLNVKKAAGSDAFEGVNVQRQAKKAGLELILGSYADPQFGPVILLGLGGVQAELLQESMLALPPLAPPQAHQLLRQGRLGTLLRQAHVDESALAAGICAFSRLVLENPRIKEVEINPLLAGPGGLLALDARVILHPRTVGERDLPRAVLLD
jgi:acetyltransferase